MSYTHGSWFHGHIDLSMRTLPTRGRAVAIYEEALATATEDKWGAGCLDLSFLDIALGGTIVTPRREHGWG
jgi:hypothetical protein